MAKTDLIVEQHESLTLGASQIASAAGLDPWRTQLQLYLDKLHGRPDRSSEAMEWGLFNEYHILQIHAKRMGVYVLGQDLNEEPCLYRPDGRPVWASAGVFKRRVSPEALALITETCVHPEHPFLTCHPDGLEMNGDGSGGSTGYNAVVGIVQAKNMSAYVKLGDELPEHYQMQAHHERLVLEGIVGHPLSHYTPIFKGGSGWRLFETTPSETVQDAIVEIAEKFLTRVMDGDPPDATLDEAGHADLARLFHGEKGKGLLVTEGTPIMDALDRLRDVTDQMAALKERKDELTSVIREEMGEHTSAKDLDKSFSVSWGEQKVKKTVGWKAVAEDMLEGVNALRDELNLDSITSTESQLEHTKLSDPYRTFRVIFK